MSANDMEKSWKSKLDKYDSPVDSSLFDAITAKAAVKSGGSYLFGWIGLGFVVLSSALIIAGFNSIQNTADESRRAEFFKAQNSKNISSLDLLNTISFNTDIAMEMSNSGKFITPHPEIAGNDNSKSKQDKGSLIIAPNSKKSASATKIINANKRVDAETSLVIPVLVENSSLESDEQNSVPLPSGEVVSFEDANVRLGATVPINVFFPVKSKSNLFLPGMIDPENCFNDAKGRSSFYVDAYIGAGNSIRSLVAIENQSNYMHLRDSLEKSWYNSAAGARIGFILASGVAIETGAEYQVHNEIFEYKNESEVRITYKYHYDQFGTVTRIDTITEIGARTLRTHNKYQQITIPLRLGYTMEKGRWMLGARLGLGLHIWNHQHGVILDNNYQTYKIEEDPEDYFNKNWGMQYNASLQIGYRLFPQTFLMVEPVWSSQSSGITQRPYTIEQKYQTLRLNVGIRFVPGSY